MGGPVGINNMRENLFTCGENSRNAFFGRGKSGNRVAKVPTDPSSRVGEDVPGKAL